MPRTSIQLNAEKVTLLIAQKNLTNKAVLDGMSDKTIYRIKAGRKTSPATAHQLAEKLGTTVEDLMTPLSPKELGALLPDQWLYDEVQPCAPGSGYMPFYIGVGNGISKYLVGCSPIDIANPLEALLKWHDMDGKRIVLRQERQAFVFEIHHFHYSPDHEQQIKYYASTACRVFPLARNDDTFTKTTLAPLLHQYVWSALQKEALANAELVSIDGHDYPEHTHTYFPLVRFFQGSAIHRRALGARLFQQLHGDFRASLIGYLRDLGSRRFSARTSPYGIVLSVDAVRPAVFKPDWHEDALDMEILLAWRKPNGTLALAPWRMAHRDKVVNGINERQWNNIYSPGMPLPRLTPGDNDDDQQDPPPFLADPDLAPATIDAIRSIDYPDPLPLLWEAQMADLTEQTCQPSACALL